MARRDAFTKPVLALLTVFSVIGGLSACNGQRAVTNDGGSASDTGKPATCGFGTHVPEFDGQCKGGTGCRYIEQPPTCGCGCAACDGEICVRTQCGLTCPDGGGRTDGGSDASVDATPVDTGPADAGERDGSLYDVHEVTETGTGTANLGPEYRFVAEKVREPQMFGDTIAWFTEYQRQGGVGVKGSDVCYYGISSKKTTCLGFDQNVYEVYRLSMFRDAIAWSYVDWRKPDATYIGLAYFNTPNGRVVDVEYGKQLDILSPVVSESSIHYVRRTDLNESEVLGHHLFSYSFAGGVKKELSKTAYPIDLYVFNSDLVYFGSADEVNQDPVVYHIDLATGIEKQLGIPTTFKYFCCGMWGRRFVYQDWQGKYGDGSDVLMYDLDSDTVTEIDAKEYGQWLPTIYENLVMWTDLSASQGIDGGSGHVWIMDLDTGVRRQITLVPGPYGARIHGNYMLLRPRADYLFSELYLYDLEKNGVIKDGHVVRQ